MYVLFLITSSYILDTEKREGRLRKKSSSSSSSDTEEEDAKGKQKKKRRSRYKKRKMWWPSRLEMILFLFLGLFCHQKVEVHLPVHVNCTLHMGGCS